MKFQQMLTPTRRRAGAFASAALSVALMFAIAAPAAANPEAAAQKVQSATGGRVLSVTPSSDPARPGYFVKVLLGDGRIRTVYVKP